MEGSQEGITVRPGEAPGTVVVEGGLHKANAALFAERLAALTGTTPALLTLELRDLEVIDGVSLAAMVNAIRTLSAKGHRVRLVGAPQLLGHNLYRVGMLAGTHAVELVNTREEEPYG